VRFTHAPGRAEETRGRRARTYDSLIIPKDFAAEGKVHYNRTNCILILKPVIKIIYK
jgi:hypothetical protein